MGTSPQDLSFPRLPFIVCVSRWAVLWSRLLHANQGHPAQLKASINWKLAVVSRQRQQQQLQVLNSCRNTFCYTKATLGCSLISQGGRVFDLAQISCWIPFLTQASHLSWLGTSIRSNWLVTPTPMRLKLCLYLVMKEGYFMCLPLRQS